MTKKTKQALSSLDWAIAQSIEQPRQPDEFTTAEFAESSGMNSSTAEKRLRRMPGISRRKITINGNLVNLFRRADSQA